jgi:hypothetical protein
MLMSSWRLNRRPAYNSVAGIYVFGATFQKLRDNLTRTSSHIATGEFGRLITIGTLTFTLCSSLYELLDIPILPSTQTSIH